MKKKIIKIGLILAAVILAAFLLLIGLAYSYEDEIKAYAVKELEAKIGVSIKVDKIEFSFIRKFPMASLSFKNIRIAGKKDSVQIPNLIKADYIYLKFNLKDIFNKKYKLRKIEAEGFVADLIVFENQSDNYHIFKESSDTSNIFIDLENISFVKSSIHYSNKYNGQFLSLGIAKSNSKVSFDNNFVDLGFVGNGKINYYKSDKNVLINNKLFSTELQLKYIFNTAGLQIKQGKLVYNSIPVQLSGSVSNLDKEAFLDLKISEIHSSFESVLAEMPEKQRENLEKYHIKGKFQIKGIVKGVLSGKKYPSVHADFAVKNAEFVYNNNKISSINFDAQFTNGAKTSLESSVINLHNLTALFSSGRITGTIAVKNLSNSEVQLNIAANLNLKVVHEILLTDYFENLSGLANVNLKSSFVVNQLLSDPVLLYKTFDLSSDIELRDANMKLKQTQIQYTRLNGNLTVDKEKININKLSGYSFKHPFSFQGVVDFSLLKFLSGYEQNISSTGDLYISSFAMSELDAYLPSGNSSESSGFPEDIYLNMNLRLDTFAWDNLIARNASGKFIMNNNGLFFNTLNLQTCEGKVAGNLHLANATKNTYLMQGNFDLSKINITSFFKSLDNFGQNYITDKNLKGLVTAKINLACNYDKDWNLISKSLNANTDISIENGELNDVRELNALSTYTKIKDFSHISFSSLSNNFWIRNDSIIIPSMELKSDKLNLTVFGAHTFDNAYDYHFKVLLNEILAKKIDKVKVTEFGDIQDDGLGRTTIFIHLYGKGENFNVKYDKSEAGKKIQTDLKKEKENIKFILKNEFGIGKQDTSAKAIQKENDKKQLKQQEEGKFIIEWEEEK